MTSNVASATPTPSIAEVEKQLSTLQQQQSVLVEKYNQSQIAVQTKQAAADAAKKAATAAAQSYDSARLELVNTVVAQYETGGFTSAEALFTSDNQQSYLEKAQTLSLISDHNDEVMATAAGALRDAKQAQSQATELLSAATAARDALAGQKTAIDAQISKSNSLLATLTAAQRAALVSYQSPTVADGQSAKELALFKNQYAGDPAGVPAPVASAIRFALDQVGKWYQYAAAGPDRFDCSGLTMRAYETGGISLPHSAALQYNYGTHLSSLADLQPGDLIFYYTPISHVTIYVGDGWMISAPETGRQVELVPVQSHASVVGATRLVPASAS